MSDPGNDASSIANVVGLGLIGGSVCLALRRAGWLVHGIDSAEGRAQEALTRGVVDAVGISTHARVTFVATPVATLVEGVRWALGSTGGVVTDVGSVKSPVAEAVDDPRFVPGHPMAGSELDGLEGADASMFEGATWVLTPTASTSDEAFSLVAEVVSSLGAEVVALAPSSHDRLVAVVSHVPHLTAAALMGVAATRSDEHAALLRLAAGGFRDMTRIASSRSGIWLDICGENRTAILDGLDDLIDGLRSMRTSIDEGNTEALRGRLDDARRARMNLPSKAGAIEDLTEVRIPIPDRPGAAAEVFTLSGDLGVNIHDFEVVHSVEGDKGVMVIVIRSEHVDLFRGGLLARGFRPATHPLS